MTPGKAARGWSDAFRLSGPLAEDPAAQVFHTLLWILTGWWGFWALILLPFHWADHFWTLQNEVVTLVMLWRAFVLLRRGHFRAASYTYLVGIWLFATHIMCFNGGMHSQAQVFYVTLPISAAWLLGYTEAVWTAVACMACAMVFALLEQVGVTLPRLIPGTPIGAWVVLGMACLIGGVPVAQILKDLRAALTKSRQAEDQSLEAMARLQTEIEEHRRTAQALQKSEERFRLAIEATNDAIWDADLEAGTVTWNETYSSLYGRPVETSDSWQWWIDRIHPDDRERTVTGLRSAINGAGSNWTCEYRFQKIDNTWAFIYDRSYIARNAAGKAWRVIGAMQDLSQRKQAEVALRESEERFRRVFEEGPLGIALVARNYRFEKVNSALCRMLDYSEEELLQKTFSDITHPDDASADIQLAEQLFQREIPFYRMEKRYLKKTGEVIWISLTAASIYDPDGEPIHGIAMVEDITEHKHNQAEALVRQKLESVGTLARGIAHDFNNILGAVRAQAELALTELAPGSSPHEALKVICGVAMRGSEIVNSLMIYAGEERGQHELVDLSKIVKEMVALLRVSVKRATLSSNLDEHLPAIRASAAQLSQLVMNLVINASEATGDREANIHVTTRRVTATLDSPLLGLVCPGQYAQLEVSDTGAGMSAETRSRVFDPFFSTKPGNRGLGLAVVHGIVRDLGGAIHLTSELGRGTSFRILLPCAGATSAAPGESKLDIGHAVPRSQGAMVLVVEDEDSLLHAASKMLHRQGFSVITARDGAAALDVIRAQDNLIDILFLDVTLPGKSGREVLEEARRLRPEMRVVVTSAYSREMAVASLQSDVEHFIRKPYRLNDLVGLMGHTLSACGCGGTEKDS